MTNEDDKAQKSGPLSQFTADGRSLSKRMRDALRDRYQETVNEPVPEKLQSLIERIRAAEQKKG
ncbi:MAG: hypothetical protein KJ871_11045 [Alphaproteobacteria bacterium]|nr:hypothetical protein [Alphaproteobacteria bacterium]MBU2083782.1 hypothetical protein [Alphaproteobacteria bacterium]MBU2141720.1 hypothetical protein [Alphaproteobacteria bacterium]MBU2197074.1 hypothetical protein [Alphaproteobacteria bacterium]